MRKPIITKEDVKKWIPNRAVLKYFNQNWKMCYTSQYDSCIINDVAKKPMAVDGGIQKKRRLTPNEKMINMSAREFIDILLISENIIAFIKYAPHIISQLNPDALCEIINSFKQQVRHNIFLLILENNKLARITFNNKNLFNLLVDNMRERQTVLFEEDIPTFSDMSETEYVKGDYVKGKERIKDTFIGGTKEDFAKSKMHSERLRRAQLLIAILKNNYLAQRLIVTVNRSIQSRSQCSGSVVIDKNVIIGIYNNYPSLELAELLVKRDRNKYILLSHGKGDTQCVSAPAINNLHKLQASSRWSSREIEKKRIETYQIFFNDKEGVKRNLRYLCENRSNIFRSDGLSDEIINKLFKHTEKSEDIDLLLNTVFHCRRGYLNKIPPEIVDKICRHIIMYRERTYTNSDISSTIMRLKDFILRNKGEYDEIMNIVFIEANVVANPRSYVRKKSIEARKLLCKAVSDKEATIIKNIEKPSWLFNFQRIDSFSYDTFFTNNDNEATLCIKLELAITNRKKRLLEYLKNDSKLRYNILTKLGMEKNSVCLHAASNDYGSSCNDETGLKSRSFSQSLVKRNEWVAALLVVHPDVFLALCDNGNNLKYFEFLLRLTQSPEHLIKNILKQISGARNQKIVFAAFVIFSEYFNSKLDILYNLKSSLFGPNCAARCSWYLKQLVVNLYQHNEDGLDQEILDYFRRFLVKEQLTKMFITKDILKQLHSEVSHVLVQEACANAKDSIREMLSPIHAAIVSSPHLKSILNDLPARERAKLAELSFHYEIEIQTAGNSNSVDRVLSIMGTNKLSSYEQKQLLLGLSIENLLGVAILCENNEIINYIKKQYELKILKYFIENSGCIKGPMIEKKIEYVCFLFSKNLEYTRILASSSFQCAKIVVSWLLHNDPVVADMFTEIRQNIGVLKALFNNYPDGFYNIFDKFDDVRKAIDDSLLAKIPTTILIHWAVEYKGILADRITSSNTTKDKIFNSFEKYPSMFISKEIGSSADNNKNKERFVRGLYISDVKRLQLLIASHAKGGTEKAAEWMQHEDFHEHRSNINVLSAVYERNPELLVNIVKECEGDDAGKALVTHAKFITMMTNNKNIFLKLIKASYAVRQTVSKSLDLLGLLKNDEIYKFVVNYANEIAHEIANKCEVWMNFTGHQLIGLVVASAINFESAISNNETAKQTIFALFEQNPEVFDSIENASKSDFDFDKEKMEGVVTFIKNLYADNPMRLSALLGDISSNGSDKVVEWLRTDKFKAVRENHEVLTMLYERHYDENHDPFMHLLTSCSELKEFLMSDAQVDFVINLFLDNQHEKTSLHTGLEGDIVDTSNIKIYGGAKLTRILTMPKEIHKIKTYLLRLFVDIAGSDDLISALKHEDAKELRDLIISDKYEITKYITDGAILTHFINIDHDFICKMLALQPKYMASFLQSLSPEDNKIIESLPLSLLRQYFDSSKCDPIVIYNHHIMISRLINESSDSFKTTLITPPALSKILAIVYQGIEEEGTSQSVRNHDVHTLFNAVLQSNKFKLLVELLASDYWDEIYLPLIEQSLFELLKNPELCDYLFMDSKNVSAIKRLCDIDKSLYSSAWWEVLVRQPKIFIYCVNYELLNKRAFHNHDVECKDIFVVKNKNLINQLTNVTVLQCLLESSYSSVKEMILSSAILQEVLETGGYKFNSEELEFISKHTNLTQIEFVIRKIERRNTKTLSVLLNQQKCLEFISESCSHVIKKCSIYRADVVEGVRLFIRRNSNKLDTDYLLYDSDGNEDNECPAQVERLYSKEVKLQPVKKQIKRLREVLESKTLSLFARNNLNVFIDKVKRGISEIETYSSNLTNKQSSKKKLIKDSNALLQYININLLNNKADGDYKSGQYIRANFIYRFVWKCLIDIEKLLLYIASDKNINERINIMQTRSLLGRINSSEKIFLYYPAMDIGDQIVSEHLDASLPDLITGVLVNLQGKYITEDLVIGILQNVSVCQKLESRISHDETNAEAKKIITFVEQCLNLLVKRATEEKSWYHAYKSLEQEFYNHKYDHVIYSLQLNVNELEDNKKYLEAALLLEDKYNKDPAQVLGFDAIRGVVISLKTLLRINNIGLRREFFERPYVVYTWFKDVHQKEETTRILEKVIEDGDKLMACWIYLYNYTEFRLLRESSWVVNAYSAKNRLSEIVENSNTVSRIPKAPSIVYENKTIKDKQHSAVTATVVSTSKLPLSNESKNILATKSDEEVPTISGSAFSTNDFDIPAISSGPQSPPVAHIPIPPPPGNVPPPPPAVGFKNKPKTLIEKLEVLFAKMTKQLKQSTTGWLSEMHQEYVNLTYDKIFTAAVKHGHDKRYKFKLQGKVHINQILKTLVTGSKSITEDEFLQSFTAEHLSYLSPFKHRGKDLYMCISQIVLNKHKKACDVISKGRIKKIRQLLLGDSLINVRSNMVGVNLKKLQASVFESSKIIVGELIVKLLANMEDKSQIYSEIECKKIADNLSKRLYGKVSKVTFSAVSNLIKYINEDIIPYEIQKRQAEIKLIIMKKNLRMNIELDALHSSKTMQKIAKVFNFNLEKDSACEFVNQYFIIIYAIAVLARQKKSSSITIKDTCKNNHEDDYQALRVAVKRSALPIDLSKISAGQIRAITDIFSSAKNAFAVQHSKKTEIKAFNPADIFGGSLNNLKTKKLVVFEFEYILETQTAKLLEQLGEAANVDRFNALVTDFASLFGRKVDDPIFKFQILTKFNKQGLFKKLWNRNEEATADDEVNEWIDADNEEIKKMFANEKCFNDFYTKFLEFYEKIELFIAETKECARKSARSKAQEKNPVLNKFNSLARLNSESEQEDMFRDENEWVEDESYIPPNAVVYTPVKIKTATDVEKEEVQVTEKRNRNLNKLKPPDPPTHSNETSAQQAQASFPIRGRGSSVRARGRAGRYVRGRGSRSSFFRNTRGRDVFRGGARGHDLNRDRREPFPARGDGLTLAKVPLLNATNCGNSSGGGDITNPTTKHDLSL